MMTATVLINDVNIKSAHLPAVQPPCEHQQVQGIQLLCHWTLLLFSCLVLWELEKQNINHAIC